MMCKSFGMCSSQGGGLWNGRMVGTWYSGWPGHMNEYFVKRIRMKGYMGRGGTIRTGKTVYVLVVPNLFSAVSPLQQISVRISPFILSDMKK